MTTVNLLAQGIPTGVNGSMAMEIAMRETATTRSTTHWEGKPTDKRDRSQTGGLMRARRLLVTAVGAHTTPPISAPSMGS